MTPKRLIVVPLLVAAACKPPTPTEQMDSVISWLGTAGMVGDAWLKSPPPGIDTASLDSVLTRSRGRVAQMARLVDAKDAPSFSRQLDSLRADEKIVKEFADKLESKQ